MRECVANKTEKKEKLSWYGDYCSCPADISHGSGRSRGSVSLQMKNANTTGTQTYAATLGQSEERAKRGEKGRQVS